MNSLLLRSKSMKTKLCYAVPVLRSTPASERLMIQSLYGYLLHYSK
jgi:hypothetical protein